MEQEQAVGLFAEDIGRNGTDTQPFCPQRRKESRDGLRREWECWDEKTRNSLKRLQYPGNMLALFWRLLPSQHPCPSSRNSTKLGSAGPPAIKPYGYIV